MAKNKLSKKQLQEYACLWMHHIGFNETEISDKLDTDIDTIILWVRQNKSKSKQSSLFINQTSSKKSQNVSIMTKEASEHSDSSRKNAVAPNGRNNEKNIFRPNG